MRLLSLLLLLPALASAQGLTPLAPGATGGGKVLWSAPFATPGCYASGQTAGASSAIAITRATSATYVDGAGAIQTCAANEFRVTTDGLLVEPARTSYVTHSDDMSTGTAATSPWSLSNATVATVAGAPIGTWAEVTSTTNAGSIRQTITTASATTFIGSVWVAKASGTGPVGMLYACTAASACSCSRSDGGTCTASVFLTNYCLAKAPDIGTTPVRLNLVATCGTAGTSVFMELFPGELSVSTGTTRFAAADLQVGTYPTSHITTAGTAVARNADQVSATVPAVPSKWCVAVTARPEEGRAWRAVSYAALWEMGNIYGGLANGAALRDRDFNTRDGAAGEKSLAYADQSSASHRLVSCSTAGALSLAIDGALTGTVSGAGTGQFTTPPTTIFLGGAGGYSSYYFGGFLKDLKICKASKPGECR